MTIPTDMRDLLIRLDQQVRDGFLAVNAKLDRIEMRADGHEQRIQKLELELAEARTTAKNIKFALGGAVALLVPTLSALVGKAFGVL